MYDSTVTADALQWAIDKLEKDPPVTQEERNYLHELKMLRDKHRGSKRPYQQPAT